VGTVLVADDDDDLRDLIAATLRDDGYDVVEARDGAELLERLDVAINSENRMPDVVITDIRMPRLSGYGVLSAIRRAGLSTAIVVMTVFADASIHGTASRLGASLVLQKPFEMETLRAAVIRACLARAT
jgi:DNA-binding response OmpR family regulator